MSKQSRPEPPAQVSTDEDERFGMMFHDDSENEDLRGVIDDLTIENKRLKQLLRLQKGRRSTSRQQEEMLFEVRMHGLAPEKKKELESLLKNFASSMHGAAGSATTSSVTKGFKARSTQSLMSTNESAAMKPAKTDSGYASNSGTPSATPSNSGATARPVLKSTRDKSIQSYLHDIPDTLLPHPPVFMTERQKMALVVRRLEQLFTGKQAAPGEHSQPLQQQEISQSAAFLDRQEDLKHNRRRRAEGTREAHIYPFSSKVNLDLLESSPEKHSQPNHSSEGPEVSIAEGTGVSNSRPHSPDQRPTRPLDLDIGRSVVPSENVEYLRHLGLFSPHLNRPSGENEPWIYLNLLINMAQLHTINVTPNFIRRAIQKMSTKFELSKDGRQVRWKGGNEATQFSRDDEHALEATQLPPYVGEENGNGGTSRSKRSKTESTSNAVNSSIRSEGRASGQKTSDASKPLVSTSGISNPQQSTSTATKTGSSFDYKPIVFRGKSASPGEESYLDSSSSYEDQSGFDSSGLAYALSRSNLNKRHADEGHITFYNNPYFFSDFSSDAPAEAFRRVSKYGDRDVIGVPTNPAEVESPLRYHDACYFTPQYAKRGFETVDRKEIAFSPPPIVAAGEDEVQPMEFPASGLGGITPQDNFAIDVKIHRTVSDGTPRRRRPFTSKPVQPRFQYNVGATHHIDLRPSQLPSPSYIFFSTSSSSNAPYLMDMSEDESSDMGDEDILAPPALLRYFSTETSSPNQGEGINQSGEENESESLDLLRPARVVDPQRVAAQEREYVIHQPGGANMIAGSLAATAGEGTRSSIDGMASVEETDSDMSTDD